MMLGGRPFWRSEGLYFGGKETEFAFTESGVVEVPRGSEQHSEINRFPRLDADGFLAYYNSGRADGYYS